MKMRGVPYIILFPKTIFAKPPNELWPGLFLLFFKSVVTFFIRDEICKAFVFYGEISPSSPWTHWRVKITLFKEFKSLDSGDNTVTTYLWTIVRFLLCLWCSFLIHNIKDIRWSLRHFPHLWFCEYQINYKNRQ